MKQIPLGDMERVFCVGNEVSWWASDWRYLRKVCERRSDGEEDDTESREAVLPVGR